MSERTLPPLELNAIAWKLPDPVHDLLWRWDGRRRLTCSTQDGAPVATIDLAARTFTLCWPQVPPGHDQAADGQ